MNDCRLKGYVLDGYPQSNGQLKDLFYIRKERQVPVENEGEENETPRFETVLDEDKDTLVWPNFVVVLDTNSDALKERVARLDPEIKENSHHNEDGYARRILAFREKFPAFLDNLQEGFQDEKTMV